MNIRSLIVVCLQTLETYSLVMVQMMFAGLKYPVTSAVCGATWVLGRVIYGYGGAEEGRNCRGTVIYM